MLGIDDLLARTGNLPFVDLEVERLRTEIVKRRQQVEDRGRQLEYVQKFWDERAKKLESSIRDYEGRLEDRSAALAHLTADPEEHQRAAAEAASPPPGPASLRFVEGTVYMIISTTVIFTNLVIILIELADTDGGGQYFWMDQFFLFFYVGELTVKAVLYQGRLLCGPPAVVWWNWLDLVIVVGGVVDEVCTIMSAASGVKMDKHSPIVMALKYLRFLRLARIMKIVQIFIKTDFHWTEGDKFQAFIMGVIGFNCLLMGLEEDCKGFFLWPYLEHVLLVIFTFELLVRLKNQRLVFFCGGGSDTVWNYLDFIIVIGGIIDGWMMPAIALVQTLLGNTTEHSSQMGQVMMLLRMARLLRMLRLMRLIKSIPPLFDLVTGIIQAMSGMGWVLLLTFVFLYTLALLGVMLIGKGILFNIHDEEALAPFTSVLEAMFVLFLAMNGDVDRLKPLMDARPVMKLFALAFMVVSSWAILSILTAVVSENMIHSAGANSESEEEERAANMTKRSRVKLEELFEEIDFDKTDDISESEFDVLVNDECYCALLMDATGLQKKGLQDLFSVLNKTPDNSGAPAVSRELFIRGLLLERKEVKERTMMEFSKRMSQLEVKLLGLGDKISVWMDRMPR